MTFDELLKAHPLPWVVKDLRAPRIIDSTGRGVVVPMGIGDDGRLQAICDAMQELADLREKVATDASNRAWDYENDPRRHGTGEMGQ